MPDKWDFDSIKERIAAIADLCRDGVSDDRENKYFKGLDTELKAVRAWVDVDKEERANAELAELRDIVANLESSIAELHGASIRNTRAPSADTESAAIKWQT